jgi:adenylate cyclase
VAERLKAEHRLIAEHHDEVTVLFADVVDFTPLSARLSPAEVVGKLDRLFTDFDALVDKHGVEKIKTIGDAYMVAAGVPTARADHAQVLARLALEMRAAAAHHLRDDGTAIRLRVGINSGPVVAGVIGRRKFIYDLWGDTVNLASRMESQGVPDRIQVAGSTYERIRDSFRLEPRGTIEVKGKGLVDTWYLLDDAASDAMPATAMTA